MTTFGWESSHKPNKISIFSNSLTFVLDKPLSAYIVLLFLCFTTFETLTTVKTIPNHYD